jgi:hypothetical protein
MSTEPQPLPIVCSLDEIELNARRKGDIAALASAVIKLSELPDGYEITLPGDAASVRTLTEFIIAERDCCRFFTLETTFASDGGEVTLRLRGPEGTKQLLAEMGLTLTSGR